MSTKTTFRSRGRLAGLVRDENPARRTRAEEALYYRARLILGDAIPRPGR